MMDKHACEHIKNIDEYFGPKPSGCEDVKKKRSVGLHAIKHFQKAPQSGMKPFRINSGNDSRDYIRRIKLRSSELTSVRRYKPIHVVAAIMMSQPFY